jgi:CheY-like chemotaxis protein
MVEQSPDIPPQGQSKAESEPGQSARLPPSAFTLLITDDDPDMLTLLRLIFERLGFRVIVTASAVDAIGICEQQAISLVISDILKPDVDGFELLRRLRSDAQTRDLPFIFASTQSDPCTREQAVKLGANGFVSEPATIEELVDAVTRVLPM